MKTTNWWRLSLVLLAASVLKFAALEKLNAIDAEHDRAVEACKAPVRRTK